jgi:hypothetical protein
MKTTLIILLTLVTAVLQAQNTTEFSEADLGKIAISVQVLPQDRLTEAQRSRLESKLFQLVTRHGVSGAGPGGTFALVPQWTVTEVRTVEGMQNIKVVDTELNLLIRQTGSRTADNPVLAGHSISLQGSAKTEQQAIENALSKLNPNDPAIGQLLNEAKQKIIQFYNARCGQVRAEAERVAATGDYEQALAILLSVPAEAEGCYAQLEAVTASLYTRYLKRNCQGQLLQAKADVAGNQFLTGLQSAAQIDPESSCYREAQQFIASTESKINAEERRLWSAYREDRRSEQKSRRQRIQAARPIVVAYYRRTPPAKRVTVHRFLN